MDDSQRVIQEGHTRLLTRLSLRRCQFPLRQRIPLFDPPQPLSPDLACPVTTEPLIRLPAPSIPLGAEWTCTMPSSVGATTEEVVVVVVEGELAGSGCLGNA